MARAHRKPFRTFLTFLFNSSRSHRRSLRVFAHGAVLVGVVALLVRLAVLRELADAPSFSVPIIDERTYDELARELLAGRPIDARFFWQGSFYPVFLCVVYAVTGGSVVAARVAQAVLGAVTAGLTFRLGEEVGGRSIGRLAGLAVALYGPLVFAEFELVATGWEVFWAVSLVLAALRASRDPNARRLALAGIVGGLSIATRATFAPFVLALGIWLTVARAGREGGRGLRVLFYFGAVLTVLLPLSLLNWRTTGHFGFLPSSGGINLYVGNNPDRARTLQIRPGPEWDRLAALPVRAGAVTPYAKDAFFVRRVVQYAVVQPGGFLAGLGDRALELVGSREVARNIDVYAYRPYSAILSLSVARIGAFGLPFGVLLPVAVLGAARGWRRLPPPLRLLLVVYPAALVLVLVSARYRAPLLPALAVAAALGVESLAGAVRSRRWGEVARDGALLAAGLVLVSWPGPFPGEENDYASEMRTLVAIAHLEARRLDEAEPLLRDALASRADDKVAHSVLGTVLTLRGRYDAAAAEFEAALRIDPAYAEAHRGFANLCVLGDRPDLALTHYRKALEVDPDDSSMLHNVGLLLRRAGDEAGAEAYLRRAQAARPAAEMQPSP